MRMFSELTKFATLAWLASILFSLSFYALLIYFGWNIGPAEIFDFLPQITFKQATGIRVLIAVLTGAFDIQLSVKS